MPTRTYDLTVARAPGAVAAIDVTAQKLVIKRAESPVTIIIERDGNDRISIAAGETRVLTAADCRPIGAVRVENDEGAGELELYWSSIICMSAESGKADAAGGAAGTGEAAGTGGAAGTGDEVVYHVVPGNQGSAPSGAAARITHRGADQYYGHSVGATAPAATGWNSTEDDGVSGRYGWLMSGSSAGGGANAVLNQYSGGHIMPRVDSPGWGHVRFSTDFFYTLVNGLAGGGSQAGFLVGRIITQDFATANPQGVGFIVRPDVSMELRAYYCNAAGVQVLEGTGIVCDDTAHRLELRLGVDADGARVVQWWIDGAMVHEVRAHAYDAPDGTHLGSLVVGSRSVYAAAAASHRQLLAGDQGRKVIISPEAL